MRPVIIFFSQKLIKRLWHLFAVNWHVIHKRGRPTFIVYTPLHISPSQIHIKRPIYFYSDRIRITALWISRYRCIWIILSTSGDIYGGAFFVIEFPLRSLLTEKYPTSKVADPSADSWASIVAVERLTLTVFTLQSHDRCWRRRRASMRMWKLLLRSFVGGAPCADDSRGPFYDILLLFRFFGGRIYFQRMFARRIRPDFGVFLSKHW